MSPRPNPSRDDAIAKNWLRAAAELIDAYLDDHQPLGERPAPLKSIHFPAALDWLNMKNVRKLLTDRGLPGSSNNAFYERWKSWENYFLPDAVIYAMTSDENFDDSSARAEQVPTIATAPGSFSDGIINVATELMDSLQRDPTNYLYLHLGPLLPQNPEIWKALIPEMRRMIGNWVDGYAELLHQFGLVLRPGWTPQRAALTLQAMLDGFLLRYRILPDDYSAATVEDVGIFADSVVAFVLGVVDAERSGVSARAAVDAMISTRNLGRDE
jgi:hypothetical protein